MLVSNAESSSQQIVPGITLGFNTDFDPAASMFNTTNFPGASSANLDAARATYAALTGRVASVNSQAVLDPGTGKYVELAPQTLEGGIKVFGMFAQDTWRLRPNLTVTGGLRYDIQTPFTPFDQRDVGGDDRQHLRAVGPGRWRSTYSRCNFLQPGNLGGATLPEYILLDKGTQGYKTDLNNIAPSVSIAWRPDVQSGFMRAILGDPNQATLRAGYSEAYDRQGLTIFTGLYGGNRGASISLSRNVNTGLVPAGESWPVLLSQTNRLYLAGVQPGSDLPDRGRAPIAPTASTRSRRTSRSPARATGRSASRGRSRRTWRSRSATSATAPTTSGRRSTTTARPATQMAAPRSAARTWWPTGS